MQNKSKSSREDELVALIRSMTAQERRYWKLYGNATSRQEKKSSLQLFEKLAAQADGRAGEKVPAKEESASARHYLFRSILKSLRSYHEEASVDIRIRELLINFEILFEKRLYTLCFGELARAKKMAYQFERYPVLFEIIFYEIETSSAHEDTRTTEVIKKLYDEFESVIASYQSDSQLKRERDEMFLQLRTRYQLSPDGPGLQESPPQQAPPQDQRLFPWLHFLGAKAFYAMRHSEWKEAAHYHQLMLDRWDAGPERIREDSKPFKRFLSNYLSVAHACGNFQVMPELIERIRSIPARSAEEEAEDFQNITYMELLLLMNTDGFHLLEHHVARIEAGLKKYKTKVHAGRELAFYHNVSMSYFLLHDWRSALNWIERIIALEKTEHRQDLQFSARMLRLVLWYELDKHDLLEYELINVERFLRKRKAWFAYESIVIKFFGKLLLAENNQKEQIEKFRAAILEARESKTTAGLPGFSELLYWTQSKLNGKSMRELVREENNKSNNKINA